MIQVLQSVMFFGNYKAKLLFYISHNKWPIRS